MEETLSSLKLSAPGNPITEVHCPSQLLMQVSVEVPLPRGIYSHMRGPLHVPSRINLVLWEKEQFSRAVCMLSPMPSTKGAGRKPDEAYEPQLVGVSGIARLNIRVTT